MRRKSVIVITVAILLLTLTFAGSCLYVRLTGRGNGVTTIWGNDAEALSDLICEECDTEREKVYAIYDWVISNIAYDYEFDTEYQYFDIKRTLNTRKGICFDFSNLFCALCRSQNISCYVLDGYNREDRENLHTWNRVRFDGVWWNLDTSYDAPRKAVGKKLYGFVALADYDSQDKEYVITRIY